MEGIKVSLYGQHSNRTPLAYSSYKKFSEGKITQTTPEDCEILVSGSYGDFAENIDEIRMLKKKKPELQLVVISEEPYWDTVCFRNICEEISPNKLQLKHYENVEIHFFGYLNSDLFEYKKIPHFLTTDINYIVRYRILIENQMRNLEGEKSGIVGMFERRVGDWHIYDKGDVKSLCNYRSELASRLSEVSVIYGVGHSPETRPRQLFPDWHLDKLARCSGKYKLMFAIENTLHPEYVTEKIFDAYACGSIQIYYGPKNHSVSTKLRLKSYIDVSSFPPQKAAVKIKAELKSRKRTSIMDDITTIQETVTVPENFWTEVEERTEKIVQTLRRVLEVGGG